MGIPKSLHALILRIFIESASFIKAQNSNNDNISTLLFEILCLFLNDYTNAELTEERKIILYLLFDISKYEFEELNPFTGNGNERQERQEKINGYNFELFINNIEGLLDFLMTILIYYVLLLAFLPKKENDLDALFEGKIISDINILSLKYDIGLKISKINKDSDWKLIKENCLNKIFEPMQDFINNSKANVVVEIPEVYLSSLYNKLEPFFNPIYLLNLLLRSNIEGKEGKLKSRTHSLVEVQPNQENQENKENKDNQVNKQKDGQIDGENNYQQNEIKNTKENELQSN